LRARVFQQGAWREVDPAGLAATLAAQDAVLWADVTGPSAGDLTTLREVFHFHPLALEDTTNQHQRPKAEEYGDHLFVILNPAKPSNAGGLFRELDVFVGANYLVTVHPEPEPVVEIVERRLETLASAVKVSPTLLFYLLVDTVVDGYFPILEALGDTAENLQNDLLLRPQQRLLHRLFHLKRNLIEMRKVVGPQRDMFNLLLRRDLPYLDRGDLQYYLRDVYDHLLRVSDMIEAFRDLVGSGVELYMSATSNRLNQVVNRLTGATVVIGALAVITGFYGMNFEHTWPPFGAEWGVPFTIVVMATTILIVVHFLRNKNR
jgi:magnesium transporter